MSKLLKGNYEIDRKEDNETAAAANNDFTKVFESKALEKLGGSIAFVVKADQFVWDGDDDVK
ncbi:MAG TPA: hypothetical protein PLU95_00805 [Syntrophales bacterium]|nr:hypothetical protein [Syntrophales bacterium]HOD97264.1 hypothetical protein [Syntrophales bacterium]HOH72008.1 hypothetical protein [Syntrophales bacterium]HPN07813.1 hypothetical protein [Syntrophales bacterium]HPX80259.1 hypothetical protein [Syntrophales bacterium]